jgi:hypothetical protein
MLQRTKRTNPKKKATHRRVVACVCIFVNPSCKYVTKIQTHQSEKKATHRRVIACVCILVNPSCNYFTPIQTHQSDKKEQRIVVTTSSCHCVRSYFVNPSCKYVTKIQTRARNPRFYFVHAGTKPRFLTQNGHQKSGIPSQFPCSDTNASIRRKRTTHRRVVACVCIFVNPSCKYVTKIQRHQSEKRQRIVVSSRAIVFL